MDLQRLEEEGHSGPGRWGAAWDWGGRWKVQGHVASYLQFRSLSIANCLGSLGFCPLCSPKS